MVLSRRLIVALSIISVTSLIFGGLLDWCFPGILANRPITSNVLSGIIGFSTSAVVIAVIFNKITRADRFRQNRRAYESALSKIEATLRDIAVDIPKEWRRPGLDSDDDIHRYSFHNAVCEGTSSQQLKSLLDDLLIPSLDARNADQMMEIAQWASSTFWPGLDPDEVSDPDPMLDDKIQSSAAIAAIGPRLARLSGPELDEITKLEGYDASSVERALSRGETIDSAFGIVDFLHNFVSVLYVLETSEPTRRLARLKRDEIAEQEAARRRWLKNDERQQRRKKGIYAIDLPTDKSPPSELASQGLSTKNGVGLLRESEFRLPSDEPMRDSVRFRRLLADVLQSPYDKAVIAAATDTTSLGVQTLSPEFLERAAAGYLKDRPPRGWLIQALTHSSVAAALAPIRDGERVVGYKLAENLPYESRFGEAIPGTLWSAAVACITEPNDLITMGKEAESRLRLRRAAHLYRKGLDAGHSGGRIELAQLLDSMGETDAVRQLFGGRDPVLFPSCPYGTDAENLPSPIEDLRRKFQRAVAADNLAIAERLYRRLAEAGDGKYALGAWSIQLESEGSSSKSDELRKSGLDVDTCSAWGGVCPEHGATLTWNGGDCHCMSPQCNRLWNYDLRLLPCIELVATDKLGRLNPYLICEGHIACRRQGMPFRRY